MEKKYQVLMVTTAAFFIGILIFLPAIVFLHESLVAGNHWKLFFEILLFFIILLITVFYAWENS